MNSENQNLQQTSNVEEGKMIAIISYITVVGLIIAFILNNDKKNSFASFHIRQSLGISATSIALSIIAIFPIIGWIASAVAGILVFVMIIQGLLAAIGGKEKPVFLLGDKFQEWFKTI